MPRFIKHHRFAYSSSPEDDVSSAKRRMNYYENRENSFASLSLLLKFIDSPIIVILISYIG